MVERHGMDQACWKAVPRRPAPASRDQGHHAAARSGNPFLAGLSRTLRRTGALPPGIASCRRMRPSLREAEARFGVPGEIIAAIIGVETIYGRHTGRFRTFAALTTLAFDYPPRAALFRRELEELLLLAREERTQSAGLPRILCRRPGPAPIPALVATPPWQGLRWRRPHRSGGQRRRCDRQRRQLSCRHGWEKDAPIAVRSRSPATVSKRWSTTASCRRRSPREWTAAGTSLTKSALATRRFRLHW
jgi:membrane-bound lytic murein transglycosylase B